MSEPPAGRAATVRRMFAGVFTALLLAASMWFYVQYVLIPHQKADAALQRTPRGNLSDLYPRWLGARELLLRHRDPYSPEVTREIQVGYYGRALDFTRPGDPKDEQGFAYPVYVVFLLAPSIGLPFAAVQAGFRWILTFLTLASVLLWLSTLRWRASRSTKLIVMMLTFGSFPVLQGIKLQQMSLLVGALIAIAVVFLDKGFLVLAGVVLAVATVKPQLVLLMAGWLLLWAVAKWRERKNFVWGFAVTEVALIAAGEYVLPGWLGKFRQAISAYRQYTGGAESVLEVLLTPGLGRALTVLVLILLAWLCWRFRQVSSDSVTFKWLLVLILAATVVIIPKTAPYNQVLLLPGVLFVLQHWEMTVGTRLSRLLAWITGVLILWPWFASVCLTAASLFLPARTVQQAWALPVYTSLTIPLALALLLGCRSSAIDNREPKAA